MLMKEVVTKTGINAYTIRYYEKAGLFRISREENGIRNFSDEEVWQLQQLSYFRQAGVPIKDLKTMFNGEMAEADIIDILYNAKKKITAELEEIQATQKYLDHKIAWHVNKGPEVTAELCGRG